MAEQAKLEVLITANNKLSQALKDIDGEFKDLTKTAR